MRAVFRNYSRAPRRCNVSLFAVLAVAPGDADAVECRVVALLNLNKFDEACKSLQGNQAVATKLPFLLCYCLYRTNQFDEASKVLESQPTPLDESWKNLAAQLRC